MVDATTQDRGRVSSLEASATTRHPHHAMPCLEIGCRIPRDYFWTIGWGIGWGESDVGIETGSYDAALNMAGIENFNIMLTFTPQRHYGTVLVGIAFSSYLYPMIGEQRRHTPTHKDKSHVRYVTQ